MKTPKTFLLLSIIVAVLILGVAYAAIQNITLSVNGNVVATPDAGNFNVQFVAGTGKKTAESAGTGTITAVANTDSKNLTATLSLTDMKKIGDVATFTIDIKNYSEDLKAKLVATQLTPEVTNADGSKANAADYFTVDATLGATDLGNAASETHTTTLTINVRMIKTPIIDGIEGLFTIVVTAEPVNE